MQPTANLKSVAEYNNKLRNSVERPWDTYQTLPYPYIYPYIHISDLSISTTSYIRNIYHGLGMPHHNSYGHISIVPTYSCTCKKILDAHVIHVRYPQLQHGIHLPQDHLQETKQCLLKTMESSQVHETWQL